MKVFLKYFALPLLIAIVASTLYIFDALIGNLIVPGASFMWVGFAVWTVFYGASIKDRIRGFIGIMVGFLAAVIMMLITGSFTLNLSSISISCLVGVFIVNALVMTMNHGEKIWLNSITGAFVGIFLSFSGFGIGLSPIIDFSAGATFVGILALYSFLGLLCGYISITVQNKIKVKLDQLNKKDTTNTNPEENNKSE